MWASVRGALEGSVLAWSYGTCQRAEMVVRSAPPSEGMGATAREHRWGPLERAAPTGEGVRAVREQTGGPQVLSKPNDPSPSQLQLTRFSLEQSRGESPAGGLPDDNIGNFFRHPCFLYRCYCGAFI